jgi:hypothetical protein
MIIGKPNSDNSFKLPWKSYSLFSICRQSPSSPNRSMARSWKFFPFLIFIPLILLCLPPTQHYARYSSIPSQLNPSSTFSTFIFLPQSTSFSSPFYPHPRIKYEDTQHPSYSTYWYDLGYASSVTAMSTSLQDTPYHPICCNTALTPDNPINSETRQSRGIS